MNLLFPEKDKVIEKRAKIVKPLGKNRYKVRDNLGRYSNVYSVATYSTGDTVRIVSGQILSKSAPVTKTQLFEV